MNNHLSYCTLY